MRIGIVTYWWANDNYGQLLQAYALQHYMQANGHNVKIIRLSIQDIIDSSRKISNLQHISNIVQHPKRIIKKVHSIWLRRLSGGKVKSRGFDAFRKQYLIFTNPYNSFEQLRQKPCDFDILICGSDVVWSNLDIESDYGKKAMDYFFLNFGSPDVKRIAYAPSFGGNSPNGEQISCIAANIGKFAKVSTRESRGRELCRKAGREDVEWLPDPTFLLDEDRWEELCANGKNGKGPYCFIYYLGSGSCISIDRIMKYFHSRRLDYIYCASDNQFDKYEKASLNISEWITTIGNSSVVITNSYHGIIFSILFHKRFVAIPLKGENAKLNERIYSLLGKLGLESQIYNTMNNSFDNILDREIDWEKIDKIKNAWCKDAYDFLDVSNI